MGRGHEFETGIYLERRLSEEELLSFFVGLHIPCSTILNEKGKINPIAQKISFKENSYPANGLFVFGSSGGLVNSPSGPQYVEELIGIAREAREEVGRETGDDYLLIEYGACGETAEKVMEYINAGCKAGGNIAVIPPPYFKYNPKTSNIFLPMGNKEEMDETVLQYYAKIAQMTQVSKVAYNIPGASIKIPSICPKGYSMSPELIREIFKMGYIGTKDSSKDKELTEGYGRIVQEFAAEGIIKRNLLGFFPTVGGLQNTDGGVPIEANLLRLIPLVIWQAKLAGDYETVEKIQKIAQRFLDLVVGGLDQKDFPKLVEGTVYALMLLGIGGGYMPSGRLAIEDLRLQQQIRDAMKEYKDERRLLKDADVPEQFIREAEKIIDGRKARVRRAN